VQSVDTQLHLPCITCINTPGILDRNNIGILLDIARMAYVRNDENNATVRAARAPNRSPNRPNKGPPINIDMENIVSRYPNITGSTPSFLERNYKDKNNIQ